MKQATFNSGAARLNYAYSEEPGKPPIVLLHGATLNWQTFMPLVPLLTPEWRIFAPDMRGHGGSDWVPGGYRFIDYSVDVRSFLAGAVREPCVVLAHSFSGYFAIYAAAHAPHLVKSMVLVDPPLFYRRVPLRETHWYSWFSKVYRAISVAESEEELGAELRRAFPGLLPAASDRMVSGLANTDPEAVLTFLEHRHMEGYDLDGLLRRVECPMLLVQADPVMGEALEDEDARHVLSVARQASLVRMEGAGHMMHASHAGALVAQVARFLSHTA